MTMESTTSGNGYTPHTVAEAAAALSVSPSTVRAHLRQGTLAGDKIDGQWVVYLAEPADAPRRATTMDAPAATGSGRRSRIPAALARIGRLPGWVRSRLRHAITRVS